MQNPSGAFQHGQQPWAERKEYGTEPAGVACMPARVHVRTHTHTRTQLTPARVSEAEGALSPRAQRGLEGGRMLRESNAVGGGTEEKFFVL